jgi:two-component system alkaline phosphatase synthesis response regulator PhoP
MDGVKRVLVVEDNPALADVVRYNLRRAGLEVDVARNGREAWERLESEDFDCVVSDYQMPEMDGRELCLRIRRTPRLAGLPIVMLTAKELELNSWEVAQELGLARIWPKPFSPAELCAAVSELVSPTPAKP